MFLLFLSWYLIDKQLLNWVLLIVKPGSKLTTVAPTTAAAGDTSVEEEEEIDPFGTIWLSLVKVW